MHVFLEDRCNNFWDGQWFQMIELGGDLGVYKKSTRSSTWYVESKVWMVSTLKTLNYLESLLLTIIFNFIVFMVCNPIVGISNSACNFCYFDPIGNCFTPLVIITYLKQITLTFNGILSIWIIRKYLFFCRWPSFLWDMHLLCISCPHIHCMEVSLSKLQD